MLLTRASFLRLLVLGIFAGGVSSARAAGPDPAATKAAIDKGVKYLQSAQAEDGTWTTPEQPGITAMCVYALLQSGVAPSDPAVQKGVKVLEGLKRDDGGIYREGTFHKNYETAISLMALQAANADGKHTKTIEAAAKFLRGLQWGGADNMIEKTSPNYGGAGYGRSARPDMSNTSFFLDALKASGAKADDEAIQRALVFVSRAQNLESEHNTTPFAALVNDGGFYYTPAAGGVSQAGKNADGGLRSYASMTYAGLKSMVYAGLSKDDPRFKAAHEWIRKHYSVTENPGLASQGLFYYYQSFAKTLAVLDTDMFEDAEGKKHDWRKDLAEKIISVQKANGSWTNENDRWMEGDPNLTTCYSLIALQNCLPKAGK